MASELRVNTLKDASGNNSIGLSYVAEGSSKAWIQVDGSTADGTANLTGVRDSFNFSSVVDNSTGNHSFAFSNNMNAADYAISNGGNYLLTSFVSNIASPANTYATTGFDIESYNSVYSAALDYDYLSADIKGDLA